MRTSEIIMLKSPARSVSNAFSPDEAVTVSKPWLRRKESSKLRCPGSSSTIRMRGPFEPFLRDSGGMGADLVMLYRYVVTRLHRYLSCMGCFSAPRRWSLQPCNPCNLCNQLTHWRSGLASRLWNCKRNRLPVRLFEAQIQHPGRQLGLARQGALAEGPAQQPDDVGRLHMSAKGAEQLCGSDWTHQNPSGKERAVSLRSQTIDQRARQGGRVDVRALEPFVPIPLVVNDPTVHVFPPERGPAVGA